MSPAAASAAVLSLLVLLLMLISIMTMMTILVVMFVVWWPPSRNVQVNPIRLTTTPNYCSNCVCLLDVRKSLNRNIGPARKIGFRKGITEDPEHYSLSWKLTHIEDKMINVAE